MSNSSDSSWDVVGELKTLTAQARSEPLTQMGIAPDQSRRMAACLAEGLLDEAAPTVSMPSLFKSMQNRNGGASC
jgi:hypothetical protein